MRMRAVASETMAAAAAAAADKENPAPWRPVRCLVENTRTPQAFATDSVPNCACGKILR